MRRATAILLVVSALPFLTGCMATAVATTAGVRKEEVRSFDEVRRSDTEFVVEYTMGTKAFMSGKVVQRDKRIQLLVPETKESRPLNELPDWHPSATSVPMRTSGNHSNIKPLTAQEQHAAYVSLNQITVVAKDLAGRPDQRVSFRPETKKYRKAWGYPVAVVGTPVAIVVDAVTFPLQWFVMGRMLKGKIN